MKRQLSIWIQLVIFVLLIGASAALWFGHERMNEVLAAFTTPREEAEQKSKTPTVRKVPVVVDRVGQQSNDVSVEAIATARAKRFVTLYPEADGEVVRFAVQAGQRVERNDVILELESRAAELAVELGKIKVNEMERMLDRSRQLQRKNVNSEARVEDSRTVLERAKVELQQAEEALSKRTLRAPFGGVVGIPKVEAGDRVTTSTAIITVDDRSEVVVEIQVPERHHAELAVGQKVVARTPGYDERTFEGVVERIDSRIDPTSRTVMVRAALPNRNDLLRPGMSFAVELVIPGKTFPTVPELALQWSGGKSFVWLVRDGKVERIDVRSVKRQNRSILVDGAVQDGDLIVVEGVQRLRNGRAVSYATPNPAPGS